MKVVALFRVSTEKQATEGASLDAQEREYRQLATAHGWTTVREFRGHESATKASADRMVLQQVLRFIAEHEVSALYVHEQSRLTRGDELEVALLMRELRERKIKILVHGTLRDPSDIDDGFMIGIQSLVDRTESARIKERMGRGKKQRAMEGKKNCGPAPFGYRNPHPGEPNRGVLQIVEEEAVVIRRIFDAAIRGRGVQAIATELNTLGIPAARGGGWVKNAIERVLVNPAYKGASAANVWKRQGKSRVFKLDMQCAEAIIVENAHAPIVSREVWDAVQNRPKRVTTKVPRLLTGLLYVDGKPYGGDSSRYGSFYRSPRGERGCPWFHTQAADDAVWNAFVSLATGAEFVEALLRAAENPKEQQLAALEVEFLEDKIGRLRRRLERLVEMRADGEMTKDQYREKSATDRASLENLEAELIVQRAKARAVDRTQGARIAKAVQTLIAGRTRLTDDQKRSILRSVVRRVDVDAAPTGALQARVEGGRLAKGSFPRWRVERVTLRLALPTAEESKLARDGDGHLATNSSCSDRLGQGRR
jgi:site-specific DNA recombinase